MALTQPTNILVSDVTLNWARLDTAYEGKYGAAWEVQIESADRSKLKGLEEAGMNIKENDGTFSASLRRKATSAEGIAMDPVRVVDANKAPMDSAARRKIGNGSKGSVIVWAAPYDNKFGKGTTFSLTAVQVVEVVEYISEVEGVADFDMVAVDTNTPEAMF